MKRRSTIRNARATGTQAVARAIGLLAAFTDRRPSWSLSELARASRLSKTTTHRLLGVLERYRLLTRDDGSYRLGDGALELGAVAQRTNGLLLAARPELERLASESGEATSLEVLRDAETLYLDEVQGQHLVGVAPCVGTRWPAHLSSTGKLLLAMSRRGDGTAWSAFIAATEGRLSGGTGKAIGSMRALIAQLDAIAETGYARAVEELEPGFVAIAAPVHDHLGRVDAAIALGGPRVRLDDNRLQALIGPLKRAAERVSVRRGWLPLRSRGRGGGAK